MYADIDGNTPQGGRTHDDGFIGMAEAARSLGALGRSGKPVAPETVCRWHHKGIALPDGTRRKLKCVRIGSKLATRPSWLWEFFEQLTTARGETVEPTTRTPAERDAAADAARRELAAMGV